jgi:glycosyltransferase involved in cell wall biosynthesis
MRVALVASSFLPEQGRLERRVDRLARGLALHGADVEILTQGPAQSSVEDSEQVTVRRFPAAVGPLRFGVAPKLRERLRVTARTFDLVDVHTRHTSLALAVSRSGVRRIVFTPATPIDAWLDWPYGRAMRALIGSGTQIVCHSASERDLLCETLVEALGRTEVVPDGVDSEAVRTARPFATTSAVVLAVDRLDRTTWVGRAIAAMPSLDPSFNLVVVGDGGARDRLVAFADDLRISSRVHFRGAVPDAILFRWLRTARVVLALGAEHGSGSQLAEAFAAGASVVASDLPVNREAAERSGGGHVIYVPPRGSPLDVADAIDEAGRVSVLPSRRGLSVSAPSWESAIDSTWTLYRQLIAADPRPARARGNRARQRRIAAAGSSLSPERVSGGRRWR